MKIAVFGASGAIGRLFVEQALSKGYQLHLYSRKKEGLPISNNIKIFVGELSNYENIRKAIQGTDAVVSLLGPPLKFSYPGMPITTGHEHIIRAMKAEGISRFITIATPSVQFDEDQASVATIMPKVMARLIFPKPYKEIVAIGALVKASGLDWTVVRFIAPVNGEAKGHVKVTFGDKKIKFSITRTDIAAFVLEELSRKEYIRSMPIIGS